MTVIAFPQKTCCQCGKAATMFIKLHDFESNTEAGRKYFCEDHAPQVTNGERQSG